MSHMAWTTILVLSLADESCRSIRWLDLVAIKRGLSVSPGSEKLQGQSKARFQRQQRARQEQGVV